jgi:hypothetical protein
VTASRGKDDMEESTLVHLPRSSLNGSRLTYLDAAK